MSAIVGSTHPEFITLAFQGLREMGEQRVSWAIWRKTPNREALHDGKCGQWMVA